MSTNENCYHFLLPTERGDHRRALLPSVRRSFRRLAAVLACWAERAAQRRRLAGLEDRLLKDIGIGRADAWRESSKWFWQD